MHKKEKLSEKVVLAEQSYNGGVVNVLEQLSHIAIVSFYKGTTIQFSALSYEHRKPGDRGQQK